MSTFEAGSLEDHQVGRVIHAALAELGEHAVIGISPGCPNLLCALRQRRIDIFEVYAVRMLSA
jgi:hypothetical protein